MANYEVDAEFIERYVPKGCELDLYEGRALITVVAFGFRDTKILGVPIPFYRDFPEINLRMYVKRKEGDGWRRGVVFIKEIIPHRLPAWIAKTVFKENFHVMPVDVELDERFIIYRWGEENYMGGIVQDKLCDWEAGTEEQFIGDNFWAYKRVNENKTLEFEVTHEAWKMCELEDVELNIDFEQLYGEEFAEAIQIYGSKPRIVFYLDGNGVGVTLPRKLETI